MLKRPLGGHPKAPLRTGRVKYKQERASALDFKDAAALRFGHTDIVFVYRVSQKECPMCK